ncbi:MAG: PH domain-containing protein [Desulfovibrionaceae bacterium]
MTGKNTIEPSGPNTALRFENPTPSYALPLLAYAAGGLMLPLAGVFFLVDRENAWPAVLLVACGALLIAWARWWSRNGMFLAVSLDETGVVVEYGNGLRPLRWDEVVDVRDSRARDGTLLQGPRYCVLLPWRADRSDEMLAFAALQLDASGFFRIRRPGSAWSRRKIDWDVEGVTVRGWLGTTRVAWSDVRDIRLDLRHPSRDYSWYGNQGITLVRVRVETAGKPLLISASRSVLDLYAALCNVWEGWKEHAGSTAATGQAAPEDQSSGDAA